MLEFPLINDTSRKIIHIDMDAFFASVEERDHPELRGKPVVIGANPLLTGGRGVVSTCNYVARQYGIHSAMSSKEAYERCPKAIFISGHYELYREVGRQIREIFYTYTDLVEPMSIDEAYLDVTNNKKNIKSAIKLARMIQEEIWEKVRLTCSAGVSYNKFLAKLASDYQKPAGMTVILPGEAEEFLKPLPVEKFHGVGKKSVERLHEIGIYTGEDLQAMKEIDLIDRFGRFGYDLYRHARGVSNTPVRPNRIRKSVGSERTYRTLLYTVEDVKTELAKNAGRVAKILEKLDARGRSVVIKVRYSDFETLTKRVSLADPTRSIETIQETAFEIYDQLEENTKGIRLLGVTVTSLVYGAENITLDLD